MIKYIKQLCNKLCANSFENSKDACILHIGRKSYPNVLTTLEKLNLKNNIETFCKTQHNRFWLLYYRITENKVDFKCGSCGVHADKCRDYVLQRVVKHIKAFNIDQESSVFLRVRILLNEEAQEEYSEEIVRFYTKKIKSNYASKTFEVQNAIAILDNIKQLQKDKKFHTKLTKICDGYKVYNTSIVLKEVIEQSVDYDEKEELKVRPLVYEELLHLVKFEAYISPVVKTRMIDFTRQTKHHPVVSDELEAQVDEAEEVLDEESIVLQNLKSEEILMNKLKYGFKLVNREFLTVIAKLDYGSEELLSTLSNEEKFYIKLVTQYDLESGSKHLEFMDIGSIERSINQKILLQREKCQVHSYSDIEEDIKKEIYIKLLYVETLSSKEMGVIFDLTAKQIDKKIENSKKKLKRSL